MSGYFSKVSDRADGVGVRIDEDRCTGLPSANRAGTEWHATVGDRGAVLHDEHACAGQAGAGFKGDGRRRLHDGGSPG